MYVSDGTGIIKMEELLLFGHRDHVNAPIYRNTFQDVIVPACTSAVPHLNIDPPSDKRTIHLPNFAQVNDSVQVKTEATLR